MDKLQCQIKVLIDKAKEAKTNQSCQPNDDKTLSSNIHNSLADQIKTKEQADAFRTLLKAY